MFVNDLYSLGDKISGGRKRGREKDGEEEGREGEGEREILRTWFMWELAYVLFIR